MKWEAGSKPPPPTKIFICTHDNQGNGTEKAKKAEDIDSANISRGFKIFFIIVNIFHANRGISRDAVRISWLRYIYPTYT